MKEDTIKHLLTKFIRVVIILAVLMLVSKYM